MAMQANKGSNFRNSEHHIAQRRAREDHEAHYDAYTRELNAIRRNSEWHEAKQKFAVGKANILNERNMEVELEQANRELKILRNQRLRELYQSEWQQHEKELNDQGLAIHQDRD